MNGFRFFLVFLLLLGLSCEKQRPKAAAKSPSVAIAQAKQGQAKRFIKTVGHMEAYATVEVMAQASGTLIKTHFEDGADVRKGQLLYSIDPKPYLAKLKLAQGQLQEEQARLGYAKRSAQRNTPLVAEDYISRDTYDQLTSTALADEALVQQKSADTELAAIHLGYTEIYSPLDARAGFSLVDDGNLLLENAETPLVVLNQLSPMYATFFIPGKDLPRLQRYHKQFGPLRACIAVDAPDGTRAEGVITFIDNQIDLATGMVQIKATLPNEDKTLWPNQYVKVEILLETLEDGVLIPVAAVQVTTEGDCVFVVQDDNTVKKQPVDLGQRQEDGWILVERGLAPQERVVVDGAMKLHDGAKVTICAPIKGSL